MGDRRLSEAAIATLVDSSVAFLTAYAQQLRELLLMVYSRASALMLPERGLHCSQLRSLTIHLNAREPLLAQEDVRQLDPAMTSLPPLRQLTQLRLDGVYLSEEALAQFLVQRGGGGGVRCNTGGGGEAGFLLTRQSMLTIV